MSWSSSVVSSWSLLSMYLGLIWLFLLFVVMLLVMGFFVRLVVLMAFSQIKKGVVVNLLRQIKIDHLVGFQVKVPLVCFFSEHLLNLLVNHFSNLSLSSKTSLGSFLNK